ncbi:MAG: hypothetical protein JWO67_3766 [Streptosporangiaceae bacterium]|nr:hypothetical protein [Streptosporangiaceae bacterium]
MPGQSGTSTDLLFLDHRAAARDCLYGVVVGDAFGAVLRPREPPRAVRTHDFARSVAVDWCHRDGLLGVHRLGTAGNGGSAGVGAVLRPVARLGSRLWSGDEPAASAGARGRSVAGVCRWTLRRGGDACGSSGGRGRGGPGGGRLAGRAFGRSDAHPSRGSRRRGCSRGEQPSAHLAPQDLLEPVLALTPAGRVHDRVAEALDLLGKPHVELAAHRFGDRSPRRLSRRVIRVPVALARGAFRDGESGRGEKQFLGGSRRRGQRVRMDCMKAARRAMEQLGTWPDLTSAPPACGIGQALWAAESEIVHFHSEHDADLHLTRTAIQRLHPELSHSSAVRLLPGSAWVTLHLDCDGDVTLLVSLVSVALRAHTTARPRPAALPCNVHHVMITPNAGPASEPDRTGTPRRRPMLRPRQHRSDTPGRRTA